MILEKCIAALIAVGLWLAPHAPMPVDIVQLTSIDWEEGDDLPDSATSLDGHTVVLTGYMHSTEPGRRRTFLLVPDTRCRCGGTPPPQKFVKVTLATGTMDFTPGRLTIAGRFDVGEETEDGFVTSLFRVRARKAP